LTSSDVQHTTTSYSQTSLSSQVWPAQTSVPASSSTAAVREEPKPRGKKASRGADAGLSEIEKARIRELACKSLRHMEAFLLYGTAGVQSYDEGKPWSEIEVMEPTTLNWRQFYKRDENGTIIVDDKKRFVGVENLTASAFAGYWWYCTCYMLSQRERRVRHPADVGRLIGTMKRLIEGSGKLDLFDRIANLTNDFDEIMAVKWKFGELPGESTLDNRLVAEAQAEWRGMSAFEQHEVRQRLESRAAAA
jgi:hypothetical protein